MIGEIENVSRRNFTFGGHFAFGCRTLACGGSVIFEKNLRGTNYREEVLEFCQIFGPHTGENIAATVYQTLVELDLTSKLTTITGDNV